MATKLDLVDWLIVALKANGGKGTIVQLCMYIWRQHEADLRSSGDLFYTWQYDVRWAANELRRGRKMRSVEVSPKGIWELV